MTIEAKTRIVQMMEARTVADLVALLIQKFACDRAAVTATGEVHITDENGSRWLDDEALNEFVDWAAKINPAT